MNKQRLLRHVGGLRVKRMMTHKKIRQQLPDYVLGLLTPGQAHEVKEHLAGCTACRRTVLGEREIGTLIRNAVHVTTHTDAARLSRLMPPVPRQTRSGQIATNWAGRLAPALVVLFLIAGSLLMVAPESKRPMALFSAATATATSTNTPTATIAQKSGGSTHLPAAALPADRIPAADPAPALAVPAPLQPATPAAAYNQMAAN